jgi:hypothetical protein
MTANNKAVKGEGLLLPPHGQNEERTNRERASSWRWWPPEKGRLKKRAGYERENKAKRAGV